MPCLLTADIHRTTNPRDEYRWGLLHWMAEKAGKLGVRTIIVLGDLTDSKDRHPSLLVNRFTSEVDDILSMGFDLIFVKGNHDYVEEGLPFFAFLEGRRAGNMPESGVARFVTKPRVLRVAIGDEPEKCLFLPSTRSADEDWAELDFNSYRYIFTHQTYSGSRVENGSLIEGLPPSIFGGYKGRVFSGDIHVPQKVNRTIEYVGAPYHIDFGDSFEPRVLMIGRTPKDEHQQQDLRYPCLQKVTADIHGLNDLDRAQAARGDQVKVRAHLRRADYHEWPALRKEIIAYAAEQGWDLFGPSLEAEPEEERAPRREMETNSATKLSPQQMVKRYASDQKLDEEMTRAGLAYLDG